MKIVNILKYLPTTYLSLIMPTLAMEDERNFGQGTYFIDKGTLVHQFLLADGTSRLPQDVVKVINTFGIALEYKHFVPEHLMVENVQFFLMQGN